MTSFSRGDSLVIDIGGTHLRFAIVEKNSCVPKDIRVYGTSTPLNYTKSLKNYLEGRVFSHSVLSLAPMLSSEGIVQFWGSQPDWVGFPLIELTERYTGGQSEFLDDCESAAIFHSTLVSNQSVGFLNLGTGVALQFASDGRGIHGLNHEFSKFGHLPVNVFEDSVCSCGKSDCIQLYFRNVKSRSSNQQRDFIRTLCNAMADIPCSHLVVGGGWAQRNSWIVGELEKHLGSRTANLTFQLGHAFPSLMGAAVISTRITK